MKNRITKDSLPNDFTLGLVFVDLIPVVFFGINCVLIGKIFSSPSFMIGAVICLFSGLLKVLWKAIVVIKKKNVWPFFIQMRIIMPIGFVIMIFSVALNLSEIDFGQILSVLTVFPQIVFLVIGFAGMVLMIVFALVFDSCNLRANWIEQITNGVSQIGFFICLLLTLKQLI